MSSGPIMARVIGRARDFFPYFNVSMLTTKSREKQYVLPRQYVWYMLRAHGMSYPWIAQNTGGWDHTTILHGVKMHATRLMNKNSSLHKTASEMNDTTKLYNEIASLREQLVQIDKQLDELNYQKRQSTYRVNDLVELMYRSTQDMEVLHAEKASEEQDSTCVQDLECNGVRRETLATG